MLTDKERQKYINNIRTIQKSLIVISIIIYTDMPMPILTHCSRQILILAFGMICRRLQEDLNCLRNDYLTEHELSTMLPEYQIYQYIVALNNTINRQCARISHDVERLYWRWSQAGTNKLSLFFESVVDTPSSMDLSILELHSSLS